MLIMLLIILSSFFIQASSTYQPFNFSFTSFDSSSCGNDSNLICHGSVTAANGSLCITPPENSDATDQAINRMGRVLYRHPVLAWPASLSATFTVSIMTDTNSSTGAGDGMAFILAQDDRPSPPNSFGSLLGILDSSTQGGIVHVALRRLKKRLNQDPSKITPSNARLPSEVATKQGAKVASFLATKQGAKVASFLATKQGAKVASFLATKQGAKVASFLATKQGAKVASFLGTKQGAKIASFLATFLGTKEQQILTVQQLAVELDTFKNEQEPDGNHMGIDTISVVDPVAEKSLNSTGIDLKSGRQITVKIMYDGYAKMLSIYVAYAGNPLKSFLNQTIKMKDTVPSHVYVGFTASTGILSETHRVLSWNFTSHELPPESLNPNSGKNNKTKIVLIVAIPVVVGLLILAVLALAFPFACRAMREKSERKEDMEMLTRKAANVPTIFTYRQLSKATGNFSKENLLGTGGFGSVYKGVLLDPPTTIAVKKISATSNQGEREYLAEICTIGRLRHKNLVQLQGWCHDCEQLLLVYEYMHNGSLDRFIGKVFLDWKTRYNILMGLASAIVYLHEECGNRIVHRDVKPNNVMLDSDYQAHLGDFGLARLLQSKASITTMVAGTPGYLAPEVSYTGRATPESDVYSFGMVVLEVVCGRRSRGIMAENSLVEFVWDLYEKGALLKCVDQMLEGKFDEDQVRRTLAVGLACLHPDYILRPKMRKVAQIFMNPDEPLVNLPESRPRAICLSLYSSSGSTTTNFGSTNAPNTTRGSMESLSDKVTVIYES